MSETVLRNPFADGYDIKVVANGFMVLPPRSHPGEFQWHGEIQVFNDATQLAAWLVARHTGDE